MTQESVQKVRWGILGCGQIATHAVSPSIRWSEIADLVAVASRTEATAATKAAEIQAPRSYGNYAALLADPEIDAVYIGLPNGLHEEWAIRAAEAGKHVLCEKSLTLNAASALRVVQACEKAGVRLMEAYMYRHHPQWDVVRSAIRDGKLGDVRIVRAGLCGQLTDTENHRWSALLGGGALYDVTCYGLNLARMIYNAEPLTVVAMADRNTREQVDRTSVALLDFGHGRLAQVSGSLSTYNHQFCEIEGNRGRITLPHPFIPGWEKTHVVVEYGMNRDVIEVSGANHFFHMIEHFSLCVVDKARPLEPGEDGLRQSLVNEAIEQSWLSGKLAEVADL